MRLRFRWFGFLFALLFAAPARAGDDARLAELAAKARDIAARLQAALDPDQCRSITSCRVTTAAAILDDGKVIIATSEKGSSLRSPLKAIKDAVGADVADGIGDAEEKIINYVQGSLFYYRNRRILVVAAGRPICERCERMILAAGARPASPCRSGRKY
jgi:hypothetical protein